MDEEVHGHQEHAVSDAFLHLGIPIETLLQSDAGRWYVHQVQQELRAAQTCGDLSLAISNTIERAAGLPAAQRQGVQGLGVLHLLAVSDMP